jgi:hypothetical protein
VTSAMTAAGRRAGRCDVRFMGRPALDRVLGYMATAARPATRIVPVHAEDRSVAVVAHVARAAIPVTPVRIHAAPAAAAGLGIAVR